MPANKVIEYLRSQGMSMSEISSTLDSARSLAKASRFSEVLQGAEADFKTLISDIENTNFNCMKPSDALKINPMSYCNEWRKVKNTLSSLIKSESSRAIQDLLLKHGINCNEYTGVTMPKEVRFVSTLPKSLNCIYGYAPGLNREGICLKGKIGEWSSFISLQSVLIYKDILNWIQISESSISISKGGLIYNFKSEYSTTGSYLDDIKCSEDDKKMLIENTPHMGLSKYVIIEQDSMLVAHEICQIEIIADGKGYEDVKFKLNQASNETKGFFVSLSSKNYCLMINPIQLSKSEKAFVCGKGYVDGELAYLCLDTLGTSAENINGGVNFHKEITFSRSYKIEYIDRLEPTDKILALERKIKPKFGNFENGKIPSTTHIPLEGKFSDYIDNVLKEAFNIESSSPEALGCDKLLFNRGINYVSEGDFNKLVSSLL